MQISDMAVEKDFIINVKAGEDDFKRELDVINKRLEQTEDQLKGVGEEGKKGFSAAERSGKKAANSLNRAFTDLKRTIAGVFATQAIIGFVRTSVKELITLEKSLASLASITGATGEDLAFLSDEATRLSRTSTKSAGEILEAFKLIGSAKPELLENKEALAELTNQAIILAEASGLTLPEAASNLGSALNALNIPAERAGELINVLAAASQKGAREIPFVNDALSKFGGIAASAGISIQESVAAVETLGKAIPEASIVGTNLRGVITKLQVEAQNAGREFNGLAAELDVYAEKQDDIVFLTKTFGQENILAIQTLIKQRGELRQLTQTITDTNTALEQQAINTDTLDAKLSMLRNNVDAIQRSFAEGLVARIDLDIDSSDIEQLERVANLIGQLGGFVIKRITNEIDRLGRRFTFFQNILNGDIFTNVLNGFGLFEDASREFEADIDLASLRVITFKNDIDDLAESLENLNKEGKLVARDSLQDLRNRLKLVKEQLEQTSPSDANFDILAAQARDLQKEIEELEKRIEGAAKEINFASGSIGDLTSQLSLLGDELQAIAPTDPRFFEKSLEAAQLERAIQSLTSTVSAYKNAIDELSRQEITFNIGDFDDEFERTFAELNAQLEGQLERILSDPSADIKESIRNLLSAISAETEEFYAKDRDDAIKSEEEKLETRQKYLNQYSQLQQGAFTFASTLFENQLASLEQRNRQGLLSDQEYAKKKAELDQKQARTEKAQALFAIALNTARGITAALASIPPRPALAAFVAAQGAIQAARVAYRPIPEPPSFFKGTEYVKRGSNKKGRDQIPAMLHEGERVIPSSINKEYREELNLIQRGKVKPGYLLDLYKTSITPVSHKELIREKKDIITNDPDFSKLIQSDYNNTSSINKRLGAMINEQRKLNETLKSRVKYAV